ncbi:hypothetical protein KIW84_011676 [Lathyrus oleraceus]|uniref:Polyprotein n=1 Tax=Pisum sativum TaxID=3888 RepID=A0A9D5GVF8_PEA|nr:hypothetical protein KIW84_011676 [Pisum sativum]
MSASSSDCQDVPETPPSKIQKEEETPDKGFQAMATTRNYESPRKNYPLAESSAQKGDESSTYGDNNYDQDTSNDGKPRSFSSKSESKDNYILRLFMENIKEEESFFEEESPEETLAPERTKPNGGPWFTFKDMPPNRWRKRLLEFGAWLDIQMMKTSANSYKIIEEFCCRMIGTMKEWYHNLGTLKQDELHHLETRNNILGVLHREFIGDMEIFDRKNIQELFEMKCYSLKTKDLNKHYHRMEQRYYVRNGYNDSSLKNTYVSSLPQELQPEIHKILAATQKDIKTMNSSSDEKSFSKSKDDRYLPVYSFKEIGSSLHTPRLSCVEVHVLATKFSCPEKVIAYMDTRAHITMMNPSILPAESWVNEDVNATKATHPGMSPSDYTLTREECNQLLKYQPRGSLQNDICIPNAQYQWTVLPFGLKRFPSKTGKIDESSIPNAKEKTPPWGTNQTEVVKALKKIAQTPSALKINGNGKRILQTDASDHYWRAVLVKELEGKIYYCGLPVANLKKLKNTITPSTRKLSL